MLNTLMTNSQVQDYYLFPTVGNGITATTITTITGLPITPGESTAVATGTTTTSTTTPFPPTTSSTSPKSSLIIASSSSSTTLSSSISSKESVNNSALFHCSMKSPEENFINHYDNRHCNELLFLLSSSSPPPPNSMKSFDTISCNAYNEDENDIHEEVRIFHDDDSNITTDKETSSCGAVAIVGKEISLGAGRKDSPNSLSPTIDSSCLLSSSPSTSSVLLTPLHISKESFSLGALCNEQQTKKEEEKSFEVNGIYCPTTTDESSTHSSSISTVSLQHHHQQQHTQNQRDRSLKENYYTTPQQDSCQNQLIQRKDKSSNQEITKALSSSSSSSNDCNRKINNKVKVVTHKQANLKQNSINNDQGKQSWNNNIVCRKASDKHQVVTTEKKDDDDNNQMIHCGDDENLHRRKTLRKQQSHCRSMSSPKICKRTEVIQSGGDTHGVGDGVQDGTTANSLCRVNNTKILHTSTCNSVSQPHRTKTPVPVPSSCCRNNEQKPEKSNLLLFSSSTTSSSSFMKDRRVISKAADEKRSAIKQAHLLASEEAVILARHKASERREAKLMEIRQRLKVRHEQVEARRKAIEMAEQQRLHQLAKQLHCDHYYHYHHTHAHTHHSHASQLPQQQQQQQSNKSTFHNRPESSLSQRKTIYNHSTKVLPPPPTQTTTTMATTTATATITPSTAVMTQSTITTTATNSFPIGFGSSTPRYVCYTSKEIMDLKHIGETGLVMMTMMNTNNNRNKYYWHYYHSKSTMPSEKNKQRVRGSHLSKFNCRHPYSAVSGAGGGSSRGVGGGVGDGNVKSRQRNSYCSTTRLDKRLTRSAYQHTTSNHHTTATNTTNTISNPSSIYDWNSLSFRIGNYPQIDNDNDDDRTSIDSGQLTNQTDQSIENIFLPSDAVPAYRTNRSRTFTAPTTVPVSVAANTATGVITNSQHLGDSIHSDISYSLNTDSSFASQKIYTNARKLNKVNKVIHTNLPNNKQLPISTNSSKYQKSTKQSSNNRRRSMSLASSNSLFTMTTTHKSRQSSAAALYENKTSRRHNSSQKSVAPTSTTTTTTTTTNTIANPIRRKHTSMDCKRPNHRNNIDKVRNYQRQKSATTISSQTPTTTSIKHRPISTSNISSSNINREKSASKKAAVSTKVVKSTGTTITTTHSTTQEECVNSKPLLSVGDNHYEMVVNPFIEEIIQNSINSINSKTSTQLTSNTQQYNKIVNRKDRLKLPLSTNTTTTTTPSPTTTTTSVVSKKSSSMSPSPSSVSSSSVLYSTSSLSTNTIIPDNNNRPTMINTAVYTSPNDTSSSITLKTQSTSLANSMSTSSPSSVTSSPLSRIPEVQKLSVITTISTTLKPTVTCSSSPLLTISYDPIITESVQLNNDFMLYEQPIIIYPNENYSQCEVNQPIMVTNSTSRSTTLLTNDEIKQDVLIKQSFYDIQSQVNHRTSQSGGDDEVDGKLQSQSYQVSLVKDTYDKPIQIVHPLHNNITKQLNQDDTTTTSTTTTIMQQSGGRLIISLSTELAEREARKKRLEGIMSRIKLHTKNTSIERQQSQPQPQPQPQHQQQQQQQLVDTQTKQADYNPQLLSSKQKASEVHRRQLQDEEEAKVKETTPNLTFMRCSSTIETLLNQRKSSTSSSDIYNSQENKTNLLKASNSTNNINHIADEQLNHHQNKSTDQLVNLTRSAYQSNVHNDDDHDHDGNDDHDDGKTRMRRDRASIVANMLASGRLDRKSRAAEILITMLSKKQLNSTEINNNNDNNDQ